MQAPLSSTASGKLVPSGFIHAVVTGPGNGIPHPFAPLPASGTRDLEQVTPRRGIEDRPATASLAESAGLAHDAGNLLGALGLYSELLAQPGVLRAEHRHYADELQLLSGRSRSLIDRLLDPQAGPREDAFASGPGIERTAGAISLPEVIDRCHGILNTITGRTVAVVYEAGATSPVAVPREALERILVNLTKNAAEASAEQGTITVRVRCQPGRSAPAGNGANAPKVVLSVEDQGCGLTAAAARVLMGERRSGARPPGRRGLGFQVVRELVGTTGGHLRLESRRGRGTLVEILWPQAGSESRSRPETREEMEAGAAEAGLRAAYVPTSTGERRGLLLMAQRGGTPGGLTTIRREDIHSQAQRDAARRITC